MSTIKAQRRLKEWSARGSNCPICGKEFRSDDCLHSVEQATERLEMRLLEARIQKITKVE